MNITGEFVVFALLFVWLAILSFFFFRYYTNTVKLSQGGKTESVLEILEDVIKREKENKKALDALTEEYLKLEKDGASHIQKIGLVRFNPFNDTGGDQSFILALIDAENTGVVISSLHTRTGTRWYAKNVKNGKGTEYELSEDERKALTGAHFLGVNKK